MNKFKFFTIISTVATSFALKSMESCHDGYPAMHVSKLASARTISGTELAKLAEKHGYYKVLVSDRGHDVVDGIPSCESRPLSRCVTSTPSCHSRPASVPEDLLNGHLTMLVVDRGLDCVDGIVPVVPVITPRPKKK